MTLGEMHTEDAEARTYGVIAWRPLHCMAPMVAVTTDME